MPHSLLNENKFLLAVGAQVSVHMEEIVEVYKGDSAVIHCHFSFAQSPNMVMVQWFVVCTIHLTTNKLVVLSPNLLKLLF